MTKVIGLDIDGVVLDYVTGFMEFMKDQGIALGCKPNEVSTYCMSNAFPDLDNDQINEWIKVFSTSSEFAELNEIEGAGRVINKIKKTYPRVKFTAITNAGAEYATTYFREFNLMHLPFDEIVVLPLNSSKAEQLAKLPTGSIYVDDLVKHVSAAQELGLRGILFRQSYNTSDYHSEVAHNWNELEKILDGYLSSNGDGK